MHPQTRPPANISQMALHAVLGAALVAETAGIFAPRKLADIALTYAPPVDLEEMANGVVHPVSKETMTKYAKIIKVLELKDVWLAAMCKELGRIAQGWGDTKGTDTVRFMTHKEIAEIPSDRVVRYARIVCNY